MYPSILNNVLTSTAAIPSASSKKHLSIQRRRINKLTKHTNTDTSTTISNNKLTCKICNKKFSRSDNLRTHQRIHTGEMPYSCKFCNKSFRWKSALSNHEDLHELKKINGPITSNIRNLPVVLNSNNSSTTTTTTTTTTSDPISSAFHKLKQQQVEKEERKLSIHVPVSNAMKAPQSSNDMISQILKDLNNNTTKEKLYSPKLSLPSSNTVTATASTPTPKPFQSIPDFPNMQFCDSIVSPSKYFFPSVNQQQQHQQQQQPQQAQVQGQMPWPLTPISLMPQSNVPVVDDRGVLQQSCANTFPNDSEHVNMNMNLNIMMSNPMESFDKGLFDSYGIRSK